MLSLNNIQKAHQVIDSIFLNSPQVEFDNLNKALSISRLILKVETLNPIRSFKGRGADFAISQLKNEGSTGIVCASAGNFGQGVAFAARKNGMKATVFAAATANPLKINAMKELGAEVILSGHDFDNAKQKARAYAEKTGQMFLEDGANPAIAEGAGTIAKEITESQVPIDALLVSLGNGSLVNGVGFWMKNQENPPQIIAVVAKGAPAMELSWRAGTLQTTETVNTIADGVAVRIPVTEALILMKSTIDSVLLVSEQAIRRAMQILFNTTGLVIEPAGCLGIAALIENKELLQYKTIATILCGSNLTSEQLIQFLKE